jgi:hypothetical protein
LRVLTALEYKEAQKIIYDSELMPLAEKIAFFPKFKIAIFRVLFNGNDPICGFIQPLHSDSQLIVFSVKNFIVVANAVLAFAQMSKSINDPII